MAGKNPPESGRKQKRVSVAARVRLKINGPMGMIRFFTKNLSEGGLFIQTPKPLPEGRKVALQFHDAEGQVLFEAQCEVAWARPKKQGDSGVPGMGLRFVELTEDGKRFIQKVLDTNRPEEEPAPREELFEESSAPKAAPTPGVQERFKDAPARNLDEELFGEPISFDDEDDFEVGEGPAPQPAPVPEAPPAPESTPPSAAAPAAEPEAVETTPPSGTAVPQPAQAEAPAPPAQSLPVRTPQPRPPKLTYPPSDLVLGIDLGTTFSCAAVVRNGTPEIVLSDRGHRTIPSVVHVGDAVDVGWSALDKISTHPEETIYGSKRLLARQFTSNAVADAIHYFSYDVVAGPGGEAAVRIDDGIYPLEWVSMRILHEIVVWAREHVKGNITKAVISVPAYYNGRQRQAVINAAEQVGLEVEQIVNEPTAASIAYGADRSVNELVLVYDLGGGTFDASLLLIQGNVFQVLATGGDAYLGGVDFDHRLVDWVLVEFERETGINLSANPVAKLRIRQACEAAKRELSERNEAQINLPFIARRGGEGVNLEMTLTRPVFEKLIEELVDRTISVCADMLQNIGTRPEDVSLTLLVGGQTRTPLVQAKVHTFTGKPPRKAVHPDESVAIGAALLGESLREVDRVSLLDMVSLPIGVAMPDGSFRPVIGSNTRLPVDQTVTLRTWEDQQTQLTIDVFQGTDEKAAANEYLGTVAVDGLPPAPAGSLFVQFTFSMDSQGFLTVTAIDTVSGELKTVELETRDTPDSLRNLGIPDDLMPDPEEAQAKRRARVQQALS